MKIGGVLFIVCSLITISLSQQPIFEENFDYPAGTNLTDYGWTAHSGAGNNPMQITTPGLTFTNYPPSGVGNAVTLVATTSSAEDVNKNFPEQSAGDVYAAFMVNVTDAQETGTYFFHLGPTSLSTNFRGRVYIQRDASNNLAFGVSKSSNTSAVFSNYLYSYNTTYLILLKYTFNTGSTSDDEVKLWIDPIIPGSEPPADLTQTDTGSDAANLGTVAIRQGTPSTGISSPGLTLDGIRVGTSWQSVTSGVVTNPPIISNVSYMIFPADQIINISSDVTIASGAIDSVYLYYFTDFTAPGTDSLQMVSAGGNEYTGSIPAQTNGTALDYWVGAWGNGVSSVSETKKVIVGVPNIGMFHTQTDTNGLPLHLNYLAKLRGIVTVNTNVFSTTNYDFNMQDNTGGINVFSFDYTPDSTQYLEGDSLDVVGTIDAFNGKVEIVDFNATIINRGNPMPQPIDVNIEDMGEEYEGRLISINNVSPTAGSNPWPTTLTSVSLDITDGTGDLILRIVDSTYIGINPEPLWPVTVVGIGNQYDFSPPFDEFYQIQPRSYGDFLTTGITDRDPLVLSFTLMQNYPNPFNPTTIIRWQLPVSSSVKLTVYNLTGQKVVTLVDDIQAAGSHSIVWNAADMASGMYFYHLEAKGYSEIRKMILMK